MNIWYIWEVICREGTEYNILALLSMMAVVCGIFVIITSNPVLSVIYLIGLFLAISVYLVIIGLYFIGLVYLVVYIGAISILFLFIIMLINIRNSELDNNPLNSISLAIFIILSLNIPLYKLLPYSITSYATIMSTKVKALMDKLYAAYIDEFYKDMRFIRMLSSHQWDGLIVALDHIRSIGSVMYTNYNMWLILSSFILLLAMVGCIVITLKPRISKSKSLLKSSVPVGGASAAAAGSGDDAPATAAEASQQIAEALREKAICEAESASFAARGMAEKAAEAAKDAHEWQETAEASQAFLSWCLGG